MVVADNVIVLDEQKEMARASLKEVSALLTRPSNERGTSPLHAYTLRGVSTDPYITYVLRAVDNEDGAVDGTAERESTEGVVDGEPAQRGSTMGYQWWRILFSTSDAKPVTKMASQIISPRICPTGGGGGGGSARRGRISRPRVRYGKQSRRVNGMASRSNKRGKGTIKMTMISSLSSSEKQPLKGNRQANGWNVCVQKVSEDQVLTAAREEGRTAILVYASDKAMDRKENPIRPLPPALEVRIFLLALSWFYDFDDSICLTQSFFLSRISFERIIGLSPLSYQALWLRQRP